MERQYTSGESVKEDSGVYMLCRVAKVMIS